MLVNNVKIISKIKRKDGIIFKLEVENKVFEIILTNHTLKRINCWRLKDLEVINALLFAEEVVIGHGNRFIAHKSRDKHIIRIIYEYQNNIPKVITVYVPSKERYFQGGEKYADKIFP